jgi:hypothetical protein
LRFRRSPKRVEQVSYDFCHSPVGSSKLDVVLIRSAQLPKAKLLALRHRSLGHKPPEQNLPS